MKYAEQRAEMAKILGRMATEILAWPRVYSVQVSFHGHAPLLEDDGPDGMVGIYMTDDKKYSFIVPWVEMHQIRGGFDSWVQFLRERYLLAIGYAAHPDANLAAPGEEENAQRIYERIADAAWDVADRHERPVKVRLHPETHMLLQRDKLSVFKPFGLPQKLITRSGHLEVVEDETLPVGAIKVEAF